MALLVVRLLGWALHVETGRDQDEDAELEDVEDDVPVVTGGTVLDADEPVEPRLGFAPPGVEPAVWE